MAPLGVRFHGTAEVWDSVADPDSGLVTLGVPLWSGHTSKDAADDTPSLLYAVGQHAFVLAKCLDKLEQNYLDALAKLRDVLAAYELPASFRATLGMQGVPSGESSKSR